VMGTQGKRRRGPSLIITDEFQLCLTEVQRGTNLFVTGKAGTGKSTLLRLICDRNKHKEVAVVAPTGVAALNVNGETIHRYFAFRPDLTPDLRRYGAPDHLADIDILVIDEVSMVRADLMDMVSRAMQFARKSWEPFGGAQVVLIGDLFQLPPVSDDEMRDTYYATDFFFSSKAFQESNISTVELTRVFRQKDDAFVEILNAIRDGTFMPHHLDALNMRYAADHHYSCSREEGQTSHRSMTIATRRDYVKDINSQHLDSIAGPTFTYSASREGEVDKKAFDDLQELRLKINAQVMMLVNQEGYSNGTIAEVRALTPNVITVYLPELDEEREVRRHTWEILKPVRKEGRVEKVVVGRFTQFPMQLAWAVTVHKSQGKTFDRVVFDCASIFEDGQTYVALSRCTSLDGLTLTQPIEPRHVKVSPAVRRFYRSATRPREALLDGTVAFVGLHTTGLDKYRKLVEVAVIRYDGESEALRLSTLVAPGRDASDAAAIGINASDLTMRPSIDEARDLLALALDGASIVGRRVHDLFSLGGWSEADVDEGVPFELADIPFGAGEQPTAMELAEQAVVDFGQLHIAHRQRIRTTPFRFLKQTINENSFLSSRSAIRGLDYLFNSDGFAALASESKAAVRLGIAMDMIAKGGDSELAMSRKLIYNANVTGRQTERMRATLLAKAEKDRRVAADEAALLNRFSEVFGLGMEPVAESDSRVRTEFRSGMKVYLSGGPGKAGSACEGLSKEDVETKCERTGVVFLHVLRKKDHPDAVVVADLSTEGGSRAKAERWGIPVMSWEELLEWATRASAT
jgi:ATP-dependent DNA helicase PIF1